MKVDSLSTLNFPVIRGVQAGREYYVSMWTFRMLRQISIFDEKELPVAADSLSKYGFEVWEPRGEVYREAARLSLAQEITVYDAAYVALAEHLRALFYTVDKKLLDRFPRRARHIRIFKEQASS